MIDMDLIPGLNQRQGQTQITGMSGGSSMNSGQRMNRISEEQIRQETAWSAAPSTRRQAGPEMSRANALSEKTFPDESRTLDLWRDVYRFYYTFRNMENTEKDWIRCMAAASGIVNLFDHDPLATALLLAVIEWIEKRMKGEYAA